MRYVIIPFLVRSHLRTVTAAAVVVITISRISRINRINRINRISKSSRTSRITISRTFCCRSRRRARRTLSSHHRMSRARSRILRIRRRSNSSSCFVDLRRIGSFSC